MKGNNECNATVKTAWLYPFTTIQTVKSIYKNTTCQVHLQEYKLSSPISLLWHMYYVHLPLVNKMFQYRYACNIGEVIIFEHGCVIFLLWNILGC